jgi:hypothetical protein
MNQGKRYIRNTVFGLYGVIVLIGGAAWLHASVVDASTPQWLRSVLVLGLKSTDKAAPASETERVQVMVLRGQRDRTQITVEGNFAVEVIGATRNKLSVTKPRNSGQKLNIRMDVPKNGPVRVTGDPDMDGAVLRIETSTITSIDAQGPSQLTVRGVRMPEMSIRMQDVAAARLQDSAVGRWILHSDTPLEVLVDKATASAGLDVQTSGPLTIRQE